MKKTYHEIAPEVLERLNAKKLTEDDKILVSEFIWTNVIKEVVKIMLKDLPMSQKDFAKMINVKPPMITAYKKGEGIPSMPTFFMMLSVLNPKLLNVITGGQLDVANALFKSYGIDMKI